MLLPVAHPRTDHSRTLHRPSIALLLIAHITLAVGLCGLLPASVAPMWVWPLSVITPALLAGCAALFLLIALWAPKSARLAWIGLLMAALGMVSVALMARGQVASPSAEAPTIRVVAYNLWGNNRNPDATANWLLSQHADVIILLETGGQSMRVIERLTRSYPFQIGCRGTRRCATMILSRHRPEIARGLSHGDADNRRALSAALMQFDGALDDIVVVGVHLSRPLPVGAQSKEIKELMAHLAPMPRDRIIVAGDFNAPPWSTTIRGLMTNSGLRFLGSWRPSWPTGSAGYSIPLLVPIDHVLVGPGVLKAELRRGPDTGSDHLPSIIDIERSSVSR